jgi:CHAT domain-containing protein/tetratricopeptide (TPR) repeat protein
MWTPIPFALAGLLLGASPGTPAVAGGVVVETVTPASAAAQAGLLPGDVLQAWSRGAAPEASADAGGPFESPFDVTEAELEQAPRGEVTIHGMRAGRTQAWRLPVGTWGLQVRPDLEASLLALHDEARAHAQAGAVDQAGAAWRRAADAAQAENLPLLTAWLRSRAGKVNSDAGRWAEADEAYRQAVAEAQAAEQPLVAASLLREWGSPFRRRSDWNQAEECYQRALAEGAKVAPASLASAQSLNALGVLAWYRGDLAAAEERHRQALALREGLAPRSVVVAASLNNLGLVSDVRGDLAAAEAYHRRALAVREQVLPGSTDVAISLHNLSIVLSGRRGFAAAEELELRALAIFEKLDPDSQDVASTLGGLGLLAYYRRDAPAARAYLERALSLFEKIAPESDDTAHGIFNLGNAAHLEGDFAEAEALYRRALALGDKTSPRSSFAASTRAALGELLIQRGPLDEAGEHLRQALAMREAQVPGSLYVAESHQMLGDLAVAQGDLARAEERYQAALDIRRRLAPRTDKEAESLHELGLVKRRRGHAAAADELLCAAIDSLEGQSARLGGHDESRALFDTNFTSYYRDCLETLVDRGQPAAALQVLERSRARSLLALLAERDVRFDADLPEELARERRLNDTEYDRAQTSLLHATEAAEIERLQQRREAARRRREEVAARVRLASPRLASLRYPEPLDLSGVRAALDPGTVLLAYSVGAVRTTLFAVEATPPAGDGLTVIALPVGRDELRRRVEALRVLIQGRKPRRLLRDPSTQLYDLLVRPADAQVARAERLLISPDGPLHTLPFDALVKVPDRAGGSGRERYLVEWKPLHVVNSGTVYAELKKRRGGTPGESTLVAFGDPRYPAPARAAAIRDPSLRSVVREGLSLRPLPASRGEVQAIAGLYGASARAYLAGDATEERAKATGRQVRYLHFACHGFLNERFPLESGLVLSIPEGSGEGRDNGLLQAWEIFEGVRLDADLVTLSACETALGRDMGGEGLVGLTRAFQYAGARSVLASLWKVADRSTAALMTGFYGELKAGRSRDAALRAAQMAMIASGRPTAHPFYWAAFQLMGDWK